jgi:RHS repeat-associated protein
MAVDMNRSLHIQYNPGNNLARRIMHPQGSIVNHYTLGGAKLGKMLFDCYDNLTYHEQYYGDLVIKDGQPTRILHGDGTINLNGSSVEYHYHLKDHLGNVRMVITPDGNNQPVVLQANDYYPFGMAYNMNFQSGGGAIQPNKYLYNSKEEQEMPGKWLDYGWRMYDAQLGRWHGVDPLAEKYYPISPYAYVGNNPIIFIDPDGMSLDWVHDKQNNDYVWMDNVTSSENTPEGFRYVGSNDNDILTDLNIPHDLVSQETTKIGFGLDGESGKGGAPIGTQANASGNIAISPIVSLDSKNVTENNQLGKKFEGVSIAGILSVTSKSPSKDLTLQYKGTLQVSYGDKVSWSYLTPTEGLGRSGAVSMSATVNISSNEISNANRILHKATINAGAPNQKVILAPKPIKMEWSLQRHQVLFPGR